MSLIHKIAGVGIAGPVMGFWSGLKNSTSIGLGVVGAVSAFAFSFPAGILFWGSAGMVLGGIVQTLNTIRENQRTLFLKPWQDERNKDGQPKNLRDDVPRSTLNEIGESYLCNNIKQSPLARGLYFGFKAANQVSREKIYDLNGEWVIDAINLAEFGEYKKFKK